jgi:transcription antitermination factor NusG
MSEQQHFENGSLRYWAALYVKPKHEFSAAKQLEAAFIECYLPTIITVKQWSDRKKKINEPLIKGYIFAHINERERILALQQNSVINAVMFQGKTARIPAWQIENLKTMLSEGHIDVHIGESIEKGEYVRVVQGPFEGVVGIVIEKYNDKMLAINIDLLNRSIIAKLPGESVVKTVEIQNNDIEE